VPPASRTARLLTSLLASGLVQEGGVRATTHGGGEQWDASNAWAPLQQATVFGLLATEAPAAEALAGEIARRWTRSSLISYREDGYIHEKSSATSPGFGGGGGEYAPQTGFGWSNGVLLTLLSAFDWASLE
jgi:alpha,alpha-trehalase